MMEYIYYNLDTNDFAYNNDKVNYQNHLDLNKEFCFVIQTSNSDNVIEKIEQFKAQYQNVTIEKVNIKYENDYISDENEINKLKKINEYLENLKIKTYIQLNKTYGEFNNFIIAKNEIENLKNKINSFTYIENGKQTHLSPFEKFIIIYKYVSNRLYNMSEKFNDERMRNWIGVLTSDVVICSGFASLLKCCCDQIFSPAELKCFNQGCDVLDKNNNYLGGHANNLIIINDIKYNLNGLYYADACWDCKRERNNMESSYDFCLIPIEQIIKNKKYNFSFHDLLIYNNINPNQQKENFNVFRTSEPIIIELFKIFNLKTKEELTENASAELDKLEKLHNEKNNAIKKIIAQKVDNLFNSHELTSIKNIKCPGIFPTSMLDQYPELTEFENFFNNITIENFNEEQVSHMLKSYADFCNKNPEYIATLENKENEKGIKVLIPIYTKIQRNLEHSSMPYFKKFNEKNKLLKIAEENYIFEQEKLFTLGKDFIYSNEIPEDVYARAFKVLAIFGGLSKDETNEFVLHEIEKRNVGKQTLFNLNSNETIK